MIQINLRLILNFQLHEVEKKLLENFQTTSFFVYFLFCFIFSKNAGDKIPKRVCLELPEEHSVRADNEFLCNSSIVSRYNRVIAQKLVLGDCSVNVILLVDYILSKVLLNIKLRKTHHGSQMIASLNECSPVFRGHSLFQFLKLFFNRFFCCDHKILLTHSDVIGMDNLPL